MNCIDWYEAYAFCIWDGGFLPSEAEWEAAAAGGPEQRAYPWGSAAPTGDLYLISDCDYPAGATGCSGVANIAPVGTAMLGAGRWGQLDLAGELAEWTLDYYAPYVDPCTDCVFLTDYSYRVVRGGSFGTTPKTCSHGLATAISPRAATPSTAPAARAGPDRERSAPRPAAGGLLT